MRPEKEMFMKALKEINTKLGEDIYSGGCQGNSAEVTATSGPDTVTYVVFEGTRAEAYVFLKGVINGINSMMLMKMLEKESEDADG